MSQVSSFVSAFAVELVAFALPYYLGILYLMSLHFKRRYSSLVIIKAANDLTLYLM